MYHLSHASTLLGCPALAEAAEALLPVLAAYVEWDGAHDLVAGGAGAILAALALHAVRPRGPALEVACRAADLLCRAAEPQRVGLGWPSHLGARPLSGASHGASGVALALASLHAIEPRPEYATAVAGALRFERALFDESAGDWPDLRDASSARFMSAWCHGAPGIGLVRWELLRTGTADLHPDGAAAVEEELAWAVAGTRRAFGLPRDPGVTPTHLRSRGQDGPCHGDLGNLELLRLDAERRGDRQAQLLVDRVVAAICARAATDGWRTGVAGADDVPGLMCGQAGIGYQLLRLADPTHTPSILLLHAPVPAR